MQCPECKGKVRKEGIELVCSECGLVTDEDKVDYGPDWRQFSDGKNKSRIGEPVNIAKHDNGLSTIFYANEAKSNHREYSRMLREHRRSILSKTSEINTAYGLSEIQRMSTSLGMTDSSMKQACKLFRSGMDKKFARGRSIDSFVPSVIYAVCKINKNPRTFEQIASVSKTDSKSIKRCYTTLVRELNLKVPPSSPKEYVYRIASNFDYTEAEKRQALALLDSLSDRDLSGKKSSGWAASALYYVSEERKTTTKSKATQKELSTAGDITEVTLRSKLDKFEEIENKDL